MGQTLQLALPVAIALGLSFLLFAVSRRAPVALWGLALIWLPGDIQVAGWPNILPTEAVQWLWLLVVVAALVSWLVRRPQTAAIAQSLVLLAILLAIAWPVIRNLSDQEALVELAILLAIGVLMIYRLLCSDQNNRYSPALALAVSLGGLGVTAALAGTVLVGQLAGVLSACMGAFAIREIVVGCREKSIEASKLVPVVMLALALLAIARIYAEMPAGPSALLLLALPAGLLLHFRFAFIVSLVSAVIALSWLLLTADNSSYY